MTKFLLPLYIMYSHCKYIRYLSYQRVPDQHILFSFLSVIPESSWPAHLILVPICHTREFLTSASYSPSYLSYQRVPWPARLVLVPICHTRDFLTSTSYSPSYLSYQRVPDQHILFSFLSVIPESSWPAHLILVPICHTREFLTRTYNWRSYQLFQRVPYQHILFSSMKGHFLENELQLLQQSNLQCQFDNEFCSMMDTLKFKKKYLSLLPLNWPTWQQRINISSINISSWSY